MDIAAIARPEIRFLNAIPAALTITILLLYLMHRLVYVDTPEINDAPPTSIADVIFIPKTTPTHTKEPKPKKAPDPLVAPITPDFTPPKTENKNLLIGGNMKFTPTGDPGLKIGLGTNDSVVQQVMVPPQYPRSALAKGIEGYVDVIFEVSALGVPKDVRVTRAEPEGVFEKHAVRAVKRWKYLPRDADAATNITVQERIRFKIATP